jgi:hypothetical protein
MQSKFSFGPGLGLNGDRNRARMRDPRSATPFLSTKRYEEAAHARAIFQKGHPNRLRSRSRNGKIPNEPIPRLMMSAFLIKTNELAQSLIMSGLGSFRTLPREGYPSWTIRNPKSEIQRRAF